MIQTKEDEIVTPELYDLYPEFSAIGLKVGELIPVGFAYGTDDEDVEEEIAEDDGAVDSETDSISAPQDAEEKHYGGKLVISDGFREVNDRRFHHIRLEDGSTNDLTDEEYDKNVIVSKK